MRWPSRELVADRSQGVQLAAIQELTRQWATEYDWRKCEARLNALPQFKTQIEGEDVHFIHAKSPHENTLPLIITHGWPGSVIELLEVVEPLTDPTAHGGRAEEAFDLVVPSLPGYGFSAEPTELGWDPGRVARAWAELMRRLGYSRYVAQGGDQGAAVTDAMAAQAPEGLVGIHLNFLRSALGKVGAMPADSEQERAAAAAITTFRSSGYGYFLEQSTRPQTIGYALLDSRSPWRPGCSTTTPTATTRSRAPFSTGSLGQPHPRPHPRQHHGLLAHGHRGLVGPVVLGGRTSQRLAPPGRLRRRSRSRSGSPPSPARSSRPRAAGSTSVYPTPHVLQRGRQGRSLRRLGRAGAVRDRAPRRVPVTPHGLARGCEVTRGHQTNSARCS